jgi:NADH-quinone oxidoreductase subunit L
MEVNFSDMNILPWLVPVGPLLAFLLITLVTNRSKLVRADDPREYGGHHPDYDGMRVPVVTLHSRILSIVVGMAGSFAAIIIAWTVVFDAIGFSELGREVYTSSIEWLATGTTSFNLGVLVDPLTVAMLFMVPLAVLCIFIYSIGYMANDPRQARFFSLISLFAGAMLTLVVADNLLLLFIGWEIMGLCSYMLIGFWYEKRSAYNAAIKAFMTTRVADVIMLLGIVYLYAMTGTLSFREILYNEAVLNELAAAPAIFLGGWGLSAASVIGIFLIIGTIGKSAQFPLHVWLPDAMEGPTPVSAMIHAAAMVSAGIYAVIRMFPLFAAGGDPFHGELTTSLLFMAVVGAFTALFAATIAVAQNDVKRVLAYSTISQLGFMMAALGIGAYVAAAFHLITHAFFKALLFMASGSVIHGMEHGEHHVHAHGHHDEHGETHDMEITGQPATSTAGDEAGAHEPHDEHAETGPHGHFDPQDMMNMGGLRKTMPVTFITFVIGGLSLAGFPFLTAGFWSKDEILAEAFYGGFTRGYLGAHVLVFIFLVLAATLTAFYTMRQLCLTFLGEPRTEEARHANLGRGIISATMTLPLIILAFFALFAGFVGIPSDFPLFGAIFSPEHNPFHHFVAPTLLEPPGTHSFNAIPVLFGIGAALLGLGLGYRMYGVKPLQAGEEDPLVRILGPFYRLLQNKYYFDELYDLVFVRPSQRVSHVVSEFIDRGIIDGFIHLVARVSNFIGELFKLFNLWLIDGVGDGIPQGIDRFGLWLRRVQTGRVQQYLLLVLVAALIIGLIFVVSASFIRAA